MADFGKVAENLKKRAFCSQDSCSDRLLGRWKGSLPFLSVCQAAGTGGMTAPPWAPPAH